MKRAESARTLHLHLLIGWAGLLLFAGGGGLLELLHGLKIGFYLDVSNETRRLMWTLAHAHGALLSLVQLGFAATLSLLPSWADASRDWASRCLIAGLVLVPGGFFLGGVFVHHGDPGLGIFLLPLGVLSLLTGLILTLRGVRSAQRSYSSRPPADM